MPFKRPCKLCEKKFQPTGRGCKLCDECFTMKSKHRRRIPKRKIPLFKTPKGATIKLK